MSTPNDEKSRRLAEIQNEAEELRRQKAAGADPAGLSRRQQDLVTKLDQARANGDLDVRTPRDKAVFYDNGQVTLDQPDPAKPGQRKVWRNADRAEAFCDKYKDQGYVTIGRTEGGQYLQNLDLYKTLDKDQADRQWRNLSTDYARHASGEVQAFTQTKSARHRVFQPTEQPELRHNPNIDTIKYRHWENGIESTHVERQGRTPENGWDQTIAKRQGYKDYMHDRVHEGGPQQQKDEPGKSK